MCPEFRYIGFLVVVAGLVGLYLFNSQISKEWLEKNPHQFTSLDSNAKLS